MQNFSKGVGVEKMEGGVGLVRKHLGEILMLITVIKIYIHKTQTTIQLFFWGGGCFVNSI